jgi:hypothetical protein
VATISFAATAAGLVKHTGTDQLADVLLRGTVGHVEHGRRPWDGGAAGLKSEGCIARVILLYFVQHDIIILESRKVS